MVTNKEKKHALTSKCHGSNKHWLLCNMYQNKHWEVKYSGQNNQAFVIHIYQKVKPNNDYIVWENTRTD